MTSSEKKSGHIITFYSYKGGVGRSRALANTAYQLAKAGKKVLCIDFDLEAPGLLNYFKKWTREEDQIEDRHGVIDLFYSYAECLLLPNPFRTLLNWKNLICKINIKQESKSFNLHFLGPGRQTADYGSRVTGFDWKKFYERMEGGRFIEHLRDQFREEYDYIFLDSRTGISDIGGVCTIQFPTILVLVFTSSPQSLNGIESIIENIQIQHKELRGKSIVPIIPLPSRIDRNEEHIYYHKWFDQVCRGSIGNLLASLQSNDKIENILPKIMLNYVPWYTYRDELESDLESPEDVGANAWRYQNFIRVIENATRLYESKTSDADIDWEILSENQNNIYDRLENLLDTSSSQPISLPEIMTASQDRSILEITNSDRDFANFLWLSGLSERKTHFAPTAIAGEPI